MSESTADIQIGAPADTVWARVRRFDGIDEYFPGIDSVEIDGDDRLIGMMGMTIRERLRSLDDDSRTISYSVIEGIDGLERHQATISVAPSAAGSKVTWAVEVEPDALTPLFADTYRQALESLRETLTTPASNS